MKPTTLKKARAIAGLTQQQLAQKAGVSRSAIAKLEASRTTSPHPETMNLLAKALGTDPRGLTTPMNRHIDAGGRNGREVLGLTASLSRRPDRIRAIEQSGIVDRLPDGTSRIRVQFISGEMQTALLGEKLSRPSPEAAAGSFGAYTYVHVRTIADDLLYTIAVESDDLPILRRVTDRGLVLQNALVEPDGHSAADGIWYAQQTLLPWDQILSISVLWPRAT